MFNPKITDISTEALIEKHGADAPRIVNILIEHAIAGRRHEEALELDRVRRDVEFEVQA